MSIPKNSRVKSSKSSPSVAVQIARDTPRPESLGLREKRKPKKPGPRTEVEKRKFYRSKCLPLKSRPQVNVVTLPEAAALLGFKHEKSVRRLIKSGKFDERKEIVGGKLRLVIDRVDISRYRLIEGGWLKRQLSTIPLIGGYVGKFGLVRVYAEWGKEPPIDLPTYTLTVSIEDFRRFVYTPVRTKSEYESVKKELRSRLGKKSRNFGVRFFLDEIKTERTLQRIINSVRLLSIPGESETTLNTDALIHLAAVSLPAAMKRAKRDWRAYLRQSVRYFYRDKARAHKRLFSAIDASADVDRLTELNNISDPLELSKAMRANALARRRTSTQDERDDD